MKFAKQLIETPIGRLCFSVLLDGVASMLECLNDQVVSRLTRRKALSSRDFNRRLRLRLPDARCCTAWSVNSRNDGAPPERVMLNASSAGDLLRIQTIRAAKRATPNLTPIKVSDTCSEITEGLTK